MRAHKTKHNRTKNVNKSTRLFLLLWSRGIHTRRWVSNTLKQFKLDFLWNLQPVRIRLARFGRKHMPFYRIRVCDSRSPRDGKFIEQVRYNFHVELPCNHLSWMRTSSGRTIRFHRESIIWRKFVSIMHELNTGFPSGLRWAHQTNLFLLRLTYVLSFAFVFASRRACSWCICFPGANDNTSDNKILALYNMLILVDNHSCTEVNRLPTRNSAPRVTSTTHVRPHARTHVQPSKTVARLLGESGLLPQHVHRRSRLPPLEVKNFPHNYHS